MPHDLINRPPAWPRRDFLKTTGLLGAAALVSRDARAAAAGATSVVRAAGKAPFRVLYSNDATNVTSTLSPFHRKGELWRPEMLEASVDEVAAHGVDAHLIQLAHGQVPWYRSKVYPLAEHHRWWSEFFHVDPKSPAFNLGGVHRFILDGGDVLQVFIDRCRKTGQAPFVSLRMNDAHHVEHVHTRGNTKGLHSISRFYAENPAYWLGPDPKSMLNWSISEVRDHMFALIAEQCLNYDLDGFEMDFLRHPNYFRLNETTPRERVGIMTEFVARVRAVLDQGAGGRRRWLGVRIPCYAAGFAPLGLDVAAWAEAGVDLFNVSPHYFTVQQTDLADVRRAAPGATVYQEMCHSTWNGQRVAEGYDAFTFRRTTPEQYETTAHLAYEQGADGVSLFNFAYYREHGAGERGPFAEPPFSVLDHLGDRAYLVRRPQHWFAAPGWKPPFGGVRVPLPRRMTAGKTERFDLTFAPPTGGWKTSGRFRVQAGANLGASLWVARLNGRELSASDDRSEPYANSYPSLLGTPEQMRAWTVPPENLRAGRNTIELTLDGGGSGVVEVVYLDLAIG